MATIGHLSAVTESFGMKFTGVIGYTMWGFVHVLYLIGWGNRLAAIFSWGRGLTFTKNRARMRTSLSSRHDTSSLNTPPLRKYRMRLVGHERELRFADLLSSQRHQSRHSATTMRLPSARSGR